MRRIYENLIVDHFSHNRQMAFLSGPRQVGKTTLAESVLPKAQYLNYDRPSDARAIKGGPDHIAEVVGLDDPSQGERGVVFDEIHKFPQWKRILKGFFNVANSLRKQPKIYFWDWSSVADGGMRNENFLVAHLLKSVNWWCDSGLGNYALSEPSHTDFGG